MKDEAGQLKFRFLKVFINYLKEFKLDLENNGEYRGQLFTDL